MLRALTIEGSIAPAFPRCEYETNPVGVEAENPMLMWEVKAAKPQSRGLKQTAYRVLVASSPESLDKDTGDIWDSGKIASDSMSIAYAGKRLASLEQAHWKVKAWDQEGKESAWSEISHWTTALKPEEWKAQWITAPEFIPDTSKHIGYQTKYGFEGNAWVQIDLGERRFFDAVRLWPACSRTIGESPGGEHPPGRDFPVRFRITVSDDASMQNAVTVAEQSDKDVVAIPTKEPYMMATPGAAGRYVRLIKLVPSVENKPQSLIVLKLAEMDVLADGINIAKGKMATAASSEEWLSGGLGISLLTDGRTGYDAGSRLTLRPPPLMRREFSVAKSVRRAIAGSTAQGNYALSLNGRAVSDERMAGGYMQYDKRVLVRTCDVTALLRQGENVLGVLLADGWYRSRYRLDGYDQYRDFAQGCFGDGIPRFLGELHIEYEDGTREIVGTDTKWTYTFAGPWRKTSMYDGAVYDATQEIPGWDKPGCSAKDWQPVTVSSPQTKPVLWPQYTPPIRIVETVPAITIEKTKSGTYLADYGHGFGGVCRLRLSGKRGATVSISYAMDIHPDKSLYRGSLWGAHNNADIYTLNGSGMEEFEPLFTYHGFRYAEISGLGNDAKLENIEALMVSDDFRITGRFESSDQRLNALWRAVNNSILSSMKCALADGADRDERWPWFGDCGTLCVVTLHYMMESPGYFRKRCLESADVQAKDGRFPVTVPLMESCYASALWSDATLWMAWQSIASYGDDRIAREIYPAIRAYMENLRESYLSGREPYGSVYGDWLGSSMRLRPGGRKWGENEPGVPIPVFNRLVLFHTATLFGNMARTLGNTGDLALMDELRNRLLQDPLLKAIREKSPTGAQTAYGFSLGWGAYDPAEHNHLMGLLVAAIEKHPHLTTGSPSTSILLNALSDLGRHDLAWNLALKPDYPSFGFMIDCGATTVWERMDAFIPGFGWNPDRMSSLNHVGFASIGNWMFSRIGGIRPDPVHPGYKRFVVKPYTVAGPEWVKADYDSVRGRISCHWRRTDSKVEITVVVPPNTTAEVWLPAVKPESITEDGKPLSGAEAVKVLDESAGWTRVECVSGLFLFSIQANQK